MKYLRNLENEADAIKKTYNVLYYIKPLGSMKIITTTRYTAIDLGLPSGLKWANMNVGAEKETDYGKYFQWGDTVGYTDVSHSTWSTCPGNGGNSAYNADSIAAWDAENLKSVTGMEYSTKILKPEVDAATVNMGGGNWRMPTLEDFSELVINTNYEVAEINGVKGAKFISKIDSSKYIFIPFAGFAGEGSVEYQVVLSGIWSSSFTPVISVSPEDVGYMVTSKDGFDVTTLSRFAALLIRGVC